MYLRVGNPPRTRLVVVLCSVRSIPHQRLCQQRQRFFLLHRNHYHRLLLGFLSSKKKKNVIVQISAGRASQTDQSTSIDPSRRRDNPEGTNQRIRCLCFSFSSDSAGFSSHRCCFSCLLLPLFDFPFLFSFVCTTSVSSLDFQIN